MPHNAPGYTTGMRCDQFAREYEDRPDSEDASFVFGLLPGTVTFGEVRKACAESSEDASIKPKTDSSGIWVDGSDLKTTFHT